MSDDHSKITPAEMLVRLNELQGCTRHEVESIVTSWIEPLAYATDTDLLKLTGKLRQLGITAAFIREWRQAIKSARKNSDKASPREHSDTNHRYIEKDNELFVRLIRGNDYEEVGIASFTAKIINELIYESGERSFTLSGQTAAGHQFEFSLPVADFYNDKKLAAAFLQAGGSTAIVYASMSRHLPPALQLLTTERPQTIHRYSHTGWIDDNNFLIPGGDLEGIEIDLPSKLSYKINPHARLELGLQGLDSLVRAQDSERTTVILAMIFQAALAFCMNWRSERYGIFIAGRTGTFKTSISQLMMSIFGIGFLEEETLIRWGPGATIKSIIKIATCAADMPFLIDNFKPNTGEGEKDLVSVIHTILEGGDRDRLTRVSQLDRSCPIAVWPIFNGEDTVTRDAATLARLLIVRFDARDDLPTNFLSDAQKFGPHLIAVGAAWLEWLKSSDAQQACVEAGNRFAATRSKWISILRGQKQRTVNIARVATNLATNQLTWEILQCHPTLGDFAKHYSAEHEQGLLIIAAEMSALTSQSLEANRFMETLTELIDSNRVHLLPAFTPTQDDDRNRFIGWKDPSDGTLYLLPQLARHAVERAMGPDGLNNISNNALYHQLDGLGLIASEDKGKHTKNIRTGRKIIPTLHIKVSTFEAEQAAE